MEEPVRKVVMQKPRVTNPTDRWDYDEELKYEPAGKLTLLIHASTWGKYEQGSRWSDAKIQRIESVIGDFVAGLMRTAVARCDVRRRKRSDEYTAESLPVSEHISFLEVSRRVPKGVICLLSALNFHEIGTQVPHEVWIAIDIKAWAPGITSPTVRVVRSSGKALHFGIQEKNVSGGKIRVFCPPRQSQTASSFTTKSEWMLRLRHFGTAIDRRRRP